MCIILDLLINAEWRIYVSVNCAIIDSDSACRRLEWLYKLDFVNNEELRQYCKVFILQSFNKM